MYRTEQEQFWAGDFGNAYAERNQGPPFIAAAAQLFARMFARAPDIASVLELGANVGINMHAIRQLLPKAALHAVEINQHAYVKLASIAGVSGRHGSILDHVQAEPVDLAFTCGVLIHINPDELSKVFDVLATSTRRYVAFAEYYDHEPREVSYRGHSARLWRRDWCRDFLARRPEFTLVDYGFVYRGDPRFLGEDMTWFLLEKASPDLR